MLLRTVCMTHNIDGIVPVLATRRQHFRSVHLGHNFNLFITRVLQQQQLLLLLLLLGSTGNKHLHLGNEVLLLQLLLLLLFLSFLLKIN